MLEVDTVKLPRISSIFDRLANTPTYTIRIRKNDVKLFTPHRCRIKKNEQSCKKTSEIRKKHNNSSNRIKTNKTSKVLEARNCGNQQLHTQSACVRTKCMNKDCRPKLLGKKPSVQVESKYDKVAQRKPKDRTEKATTLPRPRKTKSLPNIQSSCKRTFLDTVSRPRRTNKITVIQKPPVDRNTIKTERIKQKPKKRSLLRPYGDRIRKSSVRESHHSTQEKEKKYSSFNDFKLAAIAKRNGGKLPLKNILNGKNNNNVETMSASRKELKTIKKVDNRSFSTPYRQKISKPFSSKKCHNDSETKSIAKVERNVNGNINFILSTPSLPPSLPQISAQGQKEIASEDVGLDDENDQITNSRQRQPMGKTRQESLICPTDIDTTASISMIERMSSSSESSSLLSFSESSFLESSSITSLVEFSKEACPEKSKDSWLDSLSNFSSFYMPSSVPSLSNIAHESITASQSLIAQHKPSKMLTTNISQHNKKTAENLIQLDQMQDKFSSLASQYFSPTSTISLTTRTIRNRGCNNLSSSSLPINEVKNERNIFGIRKDERSIFNKLLNSSTYISGNIKKEKRSFVPTKNSKEISDAQNIEKRSCSHPAVNRTLDAEESCRTKTVVTRPITHENKGQLQDTKLIQTKKSSSCSKVKSRCIANQDSEKKSTLSETESNDNDDRKADEHEQTTFLTPSEEKSCQESLSRSTNHATVSLSSNDCSLLSFSESSFVESRASPPSMVEFSDEIHPMKSNESCLTSLSNHSSISMSSSKTSQANVEHEPVVTSQYPLRQNEPSTEDVVEIPQSIIISKHIETKSNAI